MNLLTDTAMPKHRGSKLSSLIQGIDAVNPGTKWSRQIVLMDGKFFAEDFKANGIPVFSIDRHGGVFDLRKH